MLRTSKNTYRGAGIYAILYTPKGGSYLDTMHYIGSSVNIKQRIEQHIASLNSGNHPGKQFQEDYNLHPERFRFCILERMDTPTQEELWKAEAKEINKHPRNRLYNTAPIPHTISAENMEKSRGVAESIASKHFAAEMQQLIAMEEQFKSGCASYEGDPTENAIEIAKQAFVRSIQYFTGVTP